MALWTERNAPRDLVERRRGGLGTSGMSANSGGGGCRGGHLSVGNGAVVKCDAVMEEPDQKVLHLVGVNHSPGAAEGVTASVGLGHNVGLGGGKETSVVAVHENCGWEGYTEIAVEQLATKSEVSGARIPVLFSYMTVLSTPFVVLAGRAAIYSSLMHQGSCAICDWDESDAYLRIVRDSTQRLLRLLPFSVGSF